MHGAPALQSQNTLQLQLLHSRRLTCCTWLQDKDAVLEDVRGIISEQLGKDVKEVCICRPVPLHLACRDRFLIQQYRCASSTPLGP